MAIRAGNPFSVQAAGTAALLSPDGSKTTLTPKDGSVILRNVNNVGRYEMQAGAKKRTIYATLRSDRESDIAPVQNLSLGGGEVKATQSPTRFADFWRPLALLCLLVLAGEWWLFARRS
jgi:hypothetical protein